MSRENLRDRLPLTLPYPCPICGAKVILSGVTEWGADDGEIVTAEYDCETEPDMDSKEWWEWFHGHFAMPYVDWMPYQNTMLKWLNVRYFYEA